MRTALLIAVFLLPLHVAAQSISFDDRSIAAGIRVDVEGHGVAVVDYDGDGWDDFYLAASNGQSVLFRNQQDGTFEDATLMAGVVFAGDAVNPLWGDVNNDGLPDLFIGERSLQPNNRLYLNKGDGSFRDVTAEAGIDSTASIGTAAFGDYDNDGRLDLFLATRGSADRLYRNVSGNTVGFEDVTDAAGVAGDPNSIAMQATWIDFDRDGDLDLFATHDANLQSRFYQNNGFMPFFEVSGSVDMKVFRNSMGVGWGDVNNDGWPDAYVSNIAEGNLFINDGNRAFEDVTEASGAGPNGMSWAVVFADFDTDGDEDLFVSNTFDFDQQPSFLYENANGQFANVASDAGAALSTNSFGAASGDFNNDGRPDLIVADEDGGQTLLINTTAAQNWAKVGLKGTFTNGSAIGARIRVVAGEKTWHRTVSGGASFCSQDSPVLHVGLAEATTIDTLEIIWDNTRTQVFTDLLSNAHYQITEGEQPIGVYTEGLADLSTKGIQLYPGYPNPFRVETSIRYALAKPERVHLSVYDALGREIEVLAEGIQSAGVHEVEFQPDRLAPGVYWYRLQTPTASLVRSMVLVR